MTSPTVNRFFQGWYYWDRWRVSDSLYVWEQWYLATLEVTTDGLEYTLQPFHRRQVAAGTEAWKRC